MHHVFWDSFHSALSERLVSVVFLLISSPLFIDCLQYCYFPFYNVRRFSCWLLFRICFHACLLRSCSLDSHDFLLALIHTLSKLIMQEFTSISVLPFFSSINSRIYLFYPYLILPMICSFSRGVNHDTPLDLQSLSNFVMELCYCILFINLYIYCPWSASIINRIIIHMFTVHQVHRIS